MKKALSILFLVFTTSIASAQLEQNLSVYQGIKFLDYSAKKIDDILKGKSYEYSGTSGNFISYNKSTQMSSYNFTVGIRNSKVTVVSWDEFVGNFDTIRNSLIDMGFKATQSSSGYENRTIIGFENLRRNLLVTLTVKGNYFTINLGVKDPKKPHTSQ